MKVRKVNVRDKVLPVVGIPPPPVGIKSFGAVKASPNYLSGLIEMAR